MHQRQEDLKLLLVGNPNAGKSTLFNALTRGHAKVGNWHGVTVGTLEKKTSLDGLSVTVCDLPGIYSVNGMSMEEKGAVSYIKAQTSAFLLFVAECAALDKVLPLIASLGVDERCALVLTKMRQFQKRGGKIDLKLLQTALGIPVLSAEGLPRRKLQAAVKALLQNGGKSRDLGNDKDAQEVRVRAREYQKHLSGFQGAKEELTRAEKLLSNGFFAIPLFFALLALSFYITFAPGLLGDFLKTAVENFFSGYLGGFAEKISSPVLRGFVRDGLLGSVGSVLCFLPQIVLLLLFLLLMEESGFLSRLAMLTDGVFSKVGLSGRAMFSLLMGFGCSAAAIMTTRGLDNKRVQKRVILCLPYISCSAKLPVYLTLSSSFFENPFLAVLLLYALGVGISFLVALFLKKDAPPFVMELAPLQVPRPVFIVKSLSFQVKQFIIKLGTVILAFFLFSWVLSSFRWDFCYCTPDESMLASICGGLKYLFAPIGCCDWKIAYAALSGLVAKENVAGALAMFYGGFPYSAASAFSFAVFLLACSPCVSAIAASARELGWGSALKNALIQTVSALLLSYLVYFLITGGGVYLLIVTAVIVAALLLGKNKVENLHRKRR